MDKDGQDKLDQALAALAREVNAASPQPGADLLERVTADASAMASSVDRVVSDAQVDVALAKLADEVGNATPRPGPDLIARVLADAASVTGPDLAEMPRKRARSVPGFGFWGFGWASGTAVAMVVALVVGIGVGMQMDPAELSIMADAADTDLSMADGGFMLEDIL